MSTAAIQIDQRDQLLTRLAKSRAVTDDLFRRVRTEGLYDRPIPERHRIVFYIGHLEAFDWNLIAGQALGLGPAHEKFDHVFAFGIDPVGGGLPTDVPSDWPSLNEVKAYALRVREKLDAILKGSTANSARNWQFPEELILNTAIEHRLMHAETLAYMLNQLPVDRMIPPQNHHSIGRDQSGPPVPARMIEIAAGRATLGISRESRSFGWDNEFEAHSVDVPAFTIDANKVTNGEFLRFVRAGGYNDRRFWSNEDWSWIQQEKIAHPHYWREHEGRWLLRAMFEEVPLPVNWPAYVSHAEAAAYARFAGKALPSEAQFHRAAYGSPEGGERDYPWGNEPPDASRGNFDFERWDPVDIGSYPAGRSRFGVEDMLGNGWEWTSSLFAPFKGFESLPFYSGYSANFFDGKHYVMKGASPRTAACMLRRSFRNWFQPHYPFIYASFRCVSA
jgi:ergothioneine biosynthesis protein EgtB